MLAPHGSMFNNVWLHVYYHPSSFVGLVAKHPVHTIIILIVISVHVNPDIPLRFIRCGVMEKYSIFDLIINLNHFLAKKNSKRLINFLIEYDFNN